MPSQETAPPGPPATRRQRPRPGAELELAVEALVHGGNGLARLDGYVVFVRGAIPGDRVRARVTRSKRDYAEARTTEVLQPSPDRIDPRAAHPGAPWQVLPYERQLEEKEAQVRDALARLGRFEDPPVEPIVPAVRQWRYRNKVEYSFGERDGELVLGFHQAGSWRQVDDVADDILAPEATDAVRLRVRDWCRAEGLSAFDRETGEGLLRNLVVREARHTGAVHARLVTGPGDFRVRQLAAAADVDGFAWTRSAAPAETTRAGTTTTVAGEEALEEELTVAGRRLRVRISPEAFFQTNTAMAEVLYGHAVELAGGSGLGRVYDLFCGIGTIGLALAGAASEVWGLEIVGEAVHDAEANARLNGVANAHFVQADARLGLRPLLERAGPPDVVVLDPPRAGLSNKVLRRVLETEAPRIVYVSCNPTTLAPNGRVLADAGYALRTVRPVDMFPQTPHIEAVALFELV